jgi:hypothetical protein
MFPHHPVIIRARIKERNDEEKAIITFRTLNRLMFTESRGRPKYPEFSWQSAETFVKVYKDDS